jgi:hypothetical protein
MALAHTAATPVSHSNHNFATLPSLKISAPRMSDSKDTKIDTQTFKRLERLRELRIEHRDLDDVINRLQMDLYVNEVQLRRLKKRKLMLKDQIALLESELIPDLNA